MVNSQANLSKSNAYINAVVLRAKEKLEQEIDKEIEELVVKMKQKKIEILAGLSLVVEENVKVDQMSNEILFIVKE